MSSLTSKQRAHLRSLSHQLTTVVHIGKDGVNASTIDATKQALHTRELLKVRVLDAAPGDADAVGRKLAESLDEAELVHVVGSVVVLYKPFPEHPEIRLPA